MWNYTILFYIDNTLKCDFFGLKPTVSQGLVKLESEISNKCIFLLFFFFLRVKDFHCDYNKNDKVT